MFVGHGLPAAGAERARAPERPGLEAKAVALLRRHQAGFRSDPRRGLLATA